jgi:hypothetical protein
LAQERPGWFVAAGLWGVGGLLLVGACLGLALARSRPRGLLVLAGGAVALLLCLRAVGIEVLMLAGVYDGNPAITPAQRHWTLVLWNPWFLAGGVAFGLAALARVSRHTRGPGRPRPGISGVESP